MLLWEILDKPNGDALGQVEHNGARRIQRLPFDTRCAALTKSGKRCRGRVRGHSDWCVFHDPELAAKRKQRLAEAPKRASRRLAHLPDGYLRKLTTRRSVGQAMDRLYREVRLGIITPDMGNVLFNILTRLLDAGLVNDPPAPEKVDRSRAAKLRPKLADLLTRAERAAWRKAVADAPEHVVKRLQTAATAPRPTRPAQDKPITLQAAS